MIRVILFEDLPQARKSAKMILDRTEDIFYAAGLEDARNAVKEVKKYNPDVILMDIEMPKIDGINALINIRKEFPRAKIVMLTAMPDDDKIFSAICCGAAGYVLKDDIDGIPEAIRAVNDELGNAFLSPSIARKAFNLIQGKLLRKNPKYVEFTELEIKVLQGLVDGYSRPNIAEKITEGGYKINLEAVNDHIKKIFAKFQVNSATAAVREAILGGYVLV